MPIVELVGIAGVGKTTLTRTVCEHSREVVPVREPFYRNPKDVPFFVRNTIALLPTLRALSGHRAEGWPSRRELAWMVILQGWAHVLQRRGNRLGGGAGEVLLLDQGPVFYLATLEGFGPGVLASPAAREWWAEMYRQWSAALDLVVLLDAPDEVCAARIRGRRKWHVVKDESDEAIFEFLARFRQEYERVISRLTDSGRGPRVIRLDTGVRSPDEIAGSILASFRTRVGGMDRRPAVA